MTINKSASWVKINNETMIEISNKSTCIVFDEIGSEIWESLLITRSLEDTIHNLTTKYARNNSERDEIAKDIRAVFGTLVENEVCY